MFLCVAADAEIRLLGYLLGCIVQGVASQTACWWRCAPHLVLQRARPGTARGPEPSSEAHVFRGDGVCRRACR